MKNTYLKSLFISLALLSATPDAKAAGIAVGEVGTHALARGGALIANPRAPSAAWLNPAALAFLKGTQLQLHLNAVGLYSSFARIAERAHGAVVLLMSNEPMATLPLHKTAMAEARLTKMLIHQVTPPKKAI